MAMLMIAQEDLSALWPNLEKQASSSRGRLGGYRPRSGDFFQAFGLHQAFGQRQQVTQEIEQTCRPSPQGSPWSRG